MKDRSDFSIVSAVLLFATLALPGGNAVAVDEKSVAGTYSIVSVAAFGDNPRGLMNLGRDGRYFIMLARQTLPKVAAGARGKGTLEENKEIVDGSIAHFGKYTVNSKDKTITFNVETSTFPNWDGAAFKRPFKVSGNQLTYTNVAPSGGGGAAEVVWKRVR